MTVNARGFRNRGKLAVCLAVLFSSVLNAQDRSRLASITGVRAVSQTSLTRVTISVNGPIDIQSQRIENPARIFVDFKRAVPTLASTSAEGDLNRGVRTIAVGDSLLRQIRVAENQRGVTRLVFDLANGAVNADIEFRTSVLAEPNCLVVELRSSAKERRLRNPLADAPAPPPTVSKRSPARGSSHPAEDRMPEPPVLANVYKLPPAEASQMPYRVPGIMLRDVGKARLPVPAVAAARMSAGRQSLTRVLGLKIGKVVIDPGHGGHDAGSIGPSGLTEKEVVLDIGRRLGLLVEERLGSEVVFTRDDDTFIPLERRTAIANQNHADLFISIHANSTQVKTAAGVETYYLNFTSSPEALEVAARENASGERGVSDLGDLIKKIALKDKIDESREFAQKVQMALSSGTAKAGNQTRDRGVRKAPFVVLIGAEMPSVLTEVGFLSNPKEEGLLRKPEYRQKLADSLFRGIAQYAGTLSHFTVAQMGPVPDED